jgi:ribonuclease HII
MAKKFIVGIDEVGRGPLAGPVALCALVLKPGFAQNNFLNFRDSKKLSAKARETWLEKIEVEKMRGGLNYSLKMQSNKVIDKKGLSFAIKKALADALEGLKLPPAQTLVLLDGGLKAPSEYKNQKTIIKGDEKELAIALASIVAKVKRDALMDKLSQKYPGYDFHKHKGYGTLAHYKALKKLGQSPIHRKSFLKRLTPLIKTPK